MSRYTHPLKSEYRRLRDLLLHVGTEAAVSEFFDVDASRMSGTAVARMARELRHEIRFRRGLAQQALCPVNDKDIQAAAEWLLDEGADTYCVNHWTGHARSRLNSRLVELCGVAPERSEKLNAPVDRGIVDSRWYEGYMEGLLDDLQRNPRTHKWLVLVNSADVNAFTNAASDDGTVGFYIHAEYEDRTVFVLTLDRE